MSENLKIRFRLSNGEEFEAEGPQEFIDSQRTDFLILIGKKNSSLKLPLPQQNTPVSPQPISVAHSSVMTSRNPSINGTSPVDSTFSGKHLWQHLLKEVGGLLILRKKARLAADEAALLILAGNKELYNQAQYSAILLSKSLKESGFETGRLDRLLENSLKQGYLDCKGSKRSRCYQLTPSGLAKAFVLAEKKVGETL